MPGEGFPGSSEEVPSSVKLLKKSAHFNTSMCLVQDRFH